MFTDLRVVSAVNTPRTQPRLQNPTFPKMLTQASDSVLIVVDVQAYFLGKIPVHERVTLVSRIAWLMRAADCLDVPIIATAENIPALGQLLPALKTLLCSGGPVYDKLSFGLLAQTDIREAFEALDRSEVVLVGMETDVCIAHSALQLHAAGYRTLVIADATASPEPNHAAGLKRMENAGIIITNTKGIFYEWARNVPGAAGLRKQLGPDLPPGLIL